MQRSLPLKETVVDFFLIGLIIGKLASALNSSSVAAEDRPIDLKPRKIAKRTASPRFCNSQLKLLCE